MPTSIRSFIVKKAFVWFALTLFLLTLSPLGFADENPWIPPGKTVSSLR